MTSPVLVDTDVFSYMFKGDSRSNAYRASLRDRRVCLSFMTVAELSRWALAHNWGPARKQSLKDALAEALVLP